MATESHELHLHSPLSRSQTGEALREEPPPRPSAWARLIHLIKLAYKPDEIEKVLCKKVEHIDNNKELKEVFLQTSLFRPSYSWLRSRPGSKVVGSFVFYKDFIPITPRPIKQWLEPKRLKFDPKLNFSQCLQHLGGALDSNRDDAFQLCVIAMEPYEKRQFAPFSWQQTLLAAAPSSLKRLDNMPQQVITAWIIHKWNLSQHIARLLTSARGEWIPSWRLKTPSRKQPVTIDLRNPEGTSMSLTWQFRAPRYAGDFNVHVWQQYRKPPSSEYADIFLVSAKRMLISLKSSNLVKSYQANRLNDNILGPSSNRSLPWSPISETVLSIIIVFEQMVRDMEQFLVGTMQEIQAMRMEGRSSPSPSKIRYLVHLDDCRGLAEMSMINALSVLSNLSTAILKAQPTISVWDAGTPFPERFNKIKKDLLYLKAELSDIEKEIQSLQKMIHEHLDLKQNTRLFVLTILAALYIPLSFLSSFFGMNITDNSPPGFSSLSKVMNDSIAGLSPLEQNHTAALLTAIGTSGPQTWSFRLYWIIGIPLVLTIPLFLIAGALLRWTVRWSTLYATNWRYVLGVPCFCASVFLYTNLDIIYWAHVGFTYSISGAFALWKLYGAFQTKVERVQWSLYTVFVGACMTGDWYIHQFFFMVSVWIYPLWRVYKGYKASQESQGDEAFQSQQASTSNSDCANRADGVT